jgi:hypothetical protein
VASAVEAPSSRRPVVAAVVTVFVLAVAVVAGLTAPTTGGTPVIFVERISSAISNAALRAGGVWWVYAFALGAVAAFNPCGFALVPAYLGLYLRDDVARMLLPHHLRGPLSRRPLGTVANRRNVKGWPQAPDEDGSFIRQKPES